MREEKPIIILMAEDDEDDIIATRRAWKKNNITNPLYVVRDGVECMEYLRREGKYNDVEKYPFPGLLLLDIKMPKMDGLLVAEEVRNDPNLQHLPIVILTTSKAEEDRIRSYELGVNAYIMKPVGFQGLAEAIRRINYFWQLVELPV